MSFRRGLCRAWHVGIVIATGWLSMLGSGADCGAAERANDTGPYNVDFLEGGIGLTRSLPSDSNLVVASRPWSVIGWLRSTRHQAGEVVVISVGRNRGGGGSPAATGWRGIVLVDGELRARVAPEVILNSNVILQSARWYAIGLTYDGARAHLYLDGREVAAQSAITQAIPAQLELAPVIEKLPGAEQTDTGVAHFGGELAALSFDAFAVDDQAIRGRAAAIPDFSLIDFDAVGSGWPLQQHAWRGLLEPQDAWTLPRANSPPGRPVVASSRVEPSPLLAVGKSVWKLRQWRLQMAPMVHVSGEQLSQASFDASSWYPAVVPGTVLTTLVTQGVYPDPDVGLNNLAIPESLSRQDYWYRTLFETPPDFQDHDLTLTFKGINYAAEIWVNGMSVGKIRGAFTRGEFDVTSLMHAGQTNVIAVRISPPPHPGIPHEQSIAAGPGDNGGALALDGPTFIATEGWDWIPGIRDRDTGIWQDVEIRATGALHLGDLHVTTHLPLPRIDSADVSIVVPIENRRSIAIQGAVTALFGGIRVRKSATFPPGASRITLQAPEFPQLHLLAPRLWWPNGYGAADLYDLEVSVSDAALPARAPSDTASLRVGIRELTYNLSLFDHDGRLRRVQVDPTLGSMHSERLIDIRHQAIKRTPNGWAESLTPRGENSSAVLPAADVSLAPYLVIRVNGVAIAARGGSWGMDDSRKRISRERLEPFFRLHREAHLNIIRNWLGQNTEDVFYDLADEYGLLVLNDFWISTQDFQLEPQDPALFLANAGDVISRYRNHPSIAVWFGRNEGVPQPILNEGLDDLVADLDGTRYYTGSSNSVNLQGSGPYNYRPPEEYFTHLAQGFSVEVGTPSLSTVESLRASIPAADLWPLNDTFAYHDWHSGGNGDVATFMAALVEQHGPASSLEDFERKAQLMNYASYRAIFEGFQSHLWTENSGRLLWMSHPAWPSNTWQIYSSDYDTGAAYYAVKKACEPLHVQLNLPDFSLAVVNTTRIDRKRLRLLSSIWSLDNRLLATREESVEALANRTTRLTPLSQLTVALATERTVLVKLTLVDVHGGIVSENTYWQGRTSADQQRLNELAVQPIDLAAHLDRSKDGAVVAVHIKNVGDGPALNIKLTVLDDLGARVLPVFYSDNYVTLLAGESRDIEIRCPPTTTTCNRVELRGWNVVKTAAEILTTSGD